VLLLLVPAVLLFATGAVAVREAGRTRDAVRAARLRSRLEGQESERRRWARELHDQTLQDLAAIEVRLGGLAATRDAEAIAAGLADTRVMVRDQIRTLRHLITELRPLALDTLGLAAALRDLGQRAEEAGVHVRCDLDDVPDRTDPITGASVYRIVQEAVTNALRHAACHEIAIVTRKHGDALRVAVRDDGIGLESPDVTGFGRTGMAERADAIGARLTWSAADDGGTLVVLDVPLIQLKAWPSRSQQGTNL
jgi:signal transduction histidine kinase